MGDVNKRRLLHWCLAAAFLHGVLECENLDRVPEVKFDAWEEPAPEAAGDQEEWLTSFLRRNGFAVRSSRAGKKMGDVLVKFATPEAGREALQACSLVGTNTQIPFRRCMKWGPKDEVVRSRQWCGADCKVAMNSLAALPAESEVTIVAGEFLPIQSKKDKSMFHLCTKCSVLPNGILPLVILATYHAAELTDVGDRFHVRARFFGTTENLQFTKPSDDEVVQLVCVIRSGMDEEFHGLLPPDQSRSIVQRRQDQVLKLMRNLEAGTPMFSTQRAELGLHSRTDAFGLSAPRLRDLSAGLDFGHFDVEDALDPDYLGD